MPQFQRPHLEAVLIAHAAIDNYFVDVTDPARLSPACNTILEQIAEYPSAARCDLVNLARTFGDEYAERLAARAMRLSVAELLDVSRDTVVALVNQLPAIGARRMKRAA